MTGPSRRRERLPFAQRLHQPRDFERVYATRQAVRMPQVVICYCANGLKVARLGVSVGVKHGNAVRRNRIKRVFRAAFRLSQTVLAGGVDYVLIPRLGVKEYTTKAVCEALLAAGKKLKVDAHA